jgi:hypothetical protein
LPQVPQLLLSVASTMQLAPHALRPLGQINWHTPATHDCPAAHAALQPPQLSGFVLVSTHACVPAELSQT